MHFRFNLENTPIHLYTYKLTQKFDSYRVSIIFFHSRTLLSLSNISYFR